MPALPITFDDKVNSPELLAFLQQYGPTKYITAEEINQIRDAINSLFTGQFGDKIIESTGFSKTGQDFTLNANWRWLIDSLAHTNPSAIVRNIPFSATGLSRIDYFVLDDSDSLIRVPGDETEDDPIAPDIPDNTIAITFVVVTDSDVSDPPTFAVTGTLNFLQKVNGPNSLGNSQIFDNGTAVGIGTTNPKGKATIFTGLSKYQILLNLQEDGTIVFANGNSTKPVPAIVGKSTQSAGLFLVAGTADGNTPGDMVFNVRKFDGNDFTDLTKKAFVISRLSTNLIEILRNGTINVPTLTIALINAAGGRTLVTKEWLLANSGTNLSRTLYIHSVTGNNSSAIPGDRTKPFLNYTAAQAMMDSNYNVPYIIIFLDVNNQEMPVLQNRNLEFFGEIDEASPTFTIINFTNTVPISGSVIEYPNSSYYAQIKFNNISIISTDTASKSLYGEYTDFEFNNCNLNWKSGIAIEARSIKGYFIDITLKTRAFKISSVGSPQNKSTEISIYNLIATSGNFQLSDSCNSITFKIANITGTGNVILCGEASLGARFELHNINLTGILTLSNASSTSNNEFVFKNTVIGTGSTVDVGTGLGIFTGIMNKSNTKGLELNGTEANNAAGVIFKNFTGLLKNFYKSSPNSVFEFHNCELYCASYLILAYISSYAANSIKFIGINTIKQTTPSPIIDNQAHATTTIEKQGTIKTNATAIDTDGTITLNDTTPNTF